MVKKENWPGMPVKIKHLSNLIQKYALRISSHVERHMALINTEEPARTVETASHVQAVESLPFNRLLPRQLYPLNLKLLEMDVYVPIDVNTFMESLLTWQRCVFACLFSIRSL